MATEELTDEPEQVEEPGDSGMRADDIDEAFIPIPKENVVGVEIDGEAVLLIEGTTSVHWLNAVGTVVWSSFDAMTTVGEIAAALSQQYAADPETVLNDVLELTRGTGRAGLLEGVAEEAPRPQAWVPPETLNVGEEIPAFELSDLDGQRVKAEDLRGRRTLLVNWSPYCGFCQQIAPELSELTPELRQRGVELVLLTIGNKDDNRKVAQAHGLDALILLQDEQEEVGIFPALGTPVAYLIDEEGKVASDLAHGAQEVPVLAQRLAGREEAPQHG